MKEAERAIDLGFQGAAMYVLLGNLYFEKMEISRSIAALKTAVEKDPQAAENIGSFALSTLTAEDYHALRTTVEAHANSNPENTGTLYSLAQMYMNENQLDRAKEYLIQLRNLVLDDLQVHYNLGLLHFRIGEEEEGRRAMARFQELKQKEREDWTRHNHGFKIRLAQAASALSKKDKAQFYNHRFELISKPCS